MSPSWPRLVGSLQSVSRCLGLLADECTERDIPSLTEIVGTVSSIYGDLEKFHPRGGNVGGRSRSTTLVVAHHESLVGGWMRVYVPETCDIKVHDEVFQSFGRVVFEKLHPRGDGSDM